MKRKKIIFAGLGVCALLVAGLVIAGALPPVDSNIVTVTTRSSEGYSASCITVSTSSISISWNGLITPPAGVKLFGALSLGGLQYATIPIYQGSGPGSYLQTGLNPGEQWWYKLKTEFSNGTSVVSGTFTCITGSAASDIPTDLSAFAGDAHTLYVNWKDNATTTSPYQFEWQRITLTPEIPISTATSSKVLSNNVPLKWEVIGSSTPYTTTIERSTSTDPGMRFDAANDPSLTPFAGVDSYDPRAIGNDHGYFTYNDISVEDATAYYYEFKTCSTILPQNLYAKEVTGRERLNTDKPSPACSHPSTPPLMVPTPPATPVSLTAAVNSSNPTSEIDLSWTNQSVRASGYEVWRSTTDTIGSATRQALLTGANQNSYQDTGLARGTTYYYWVRAYKDFGGGVMSYSDWLGPANAATIARSETGKMYASSGSHFLQNILSAAGSALWQTVGRAWERAASDLTKVAALLSGEVPTAEGAAPGVNLDAYFAQAGATVSAPLLKDISLNADSVYLYRVRVKYGGGKTSAWSSIVAGKTLKDGNPTGAKIGICTNNSFCSQVPEYRSSGNISSESQCTVNADCRKVGRSSQVFQEH